MGVRAFFGLSPNVDGKALQTGKFIGNGLFAPSNAAVQRPELAARLFALSELPKLALEVFNVFLRHFKQFVFTICFIGIPLSANAAPDIFLYIEKVEGESMVKGFENWIEVSAYGEGQSMPIAGSRSTSGSPTSGRAIFEDVNIEKLLDKASPELRFKLATGEVIPRVALVHTIIIDSLPEWFYGIIMDLVVVTKVSASGSGGTPQETLSLNFGQATWCYRPFDDRTQSLGPVITKAWDVIENAPGSGAVCGNWGN